MRATDFRGIDNIGQSTGHNAAMGNGQWPEPPEESTGTAILSADYSDPLPFTTIRLGLRFA